MILQKVTRSLAFRLPALYKRYLRLRQKANPNVRPAKAHWDLNFSIACGEYNVEFLQQTLRSIYKNFARLPKIYVFTDRHLSAERCRKAISWFPADRITVVDIAENIRYHEQEENIALVEFIKTNPLGFKLAAFFQLAAAGVPFVYCDTDVLWHADPFERINGLVQQKGSTCHLSLDFQPAYDQLLVREAGLQQLNRAPFYCTGIALIHSVTAEQRALLNELLPHVLQQSDHFTEQTIMAAMQQLAGPSGMSPDEFAIIQTDKFRVKPQRFAGVIARHYIGPVRHLFWRDAFFII